MEILHVTAECYPYAKAGGLGDVAGALPKYQNELGHIAKVVMPMHRTKFLFENEWDTVHKGSFNMGTYYFDYTIIKEKHNKLDFDLYCVDIFGLFNREKIYGYDDDIERYTAFQIAVTDWISKWQHRPDVVHVHDYHAGLVPFMMQNCIAYKHLASIPTVLTIHNAQYQGWMGWNKNNYLPTYDSWQWGKLDWNNNINPLASAIKCAHKVTTVSPSYLQELMHNANGLENLFEFEKGKCVGILNGIDKVVWDPKTDNYILDNFSIKNVEVGKRLNKKKLCDDFGLDIDKPLFIFIGRMVSEKAAELLPQVINDSVYYMNGRMNFLILGSGDPVVEAKLDYMRNGLMGYYNTQIGYNEKLAHLMYAGADFLLMPSRVEPCGLNQMYALRYGTMPLVRNTGGLKDTVKDIGEKDGFGITFYHPTVGDVTQAIYRATELYADTKRLTLLQQKMMKIDNGWEVSAAKYIDLYHSIN